MLTRCLAELRRRKQRHVRIQATRAKVEMLAREVFRLEQGIKGCVHPHPGAARRGAAYKGGRSREELNTTRRAGGGIALPSPTALSA